MEEREARNNYRTLQEDKTAFSYEKVNDLYHLKNIRQRMVRSRGRCFTVGTEEYEKYGEDPDPKAAEKDTEYLNQNSVT